MLNKFGEWYSKYDSEVTWWLIGWLSWGMIDQLARGSYGFALLNAVLIVMNYQMWKNRR